MSNKIDDYINQQGLPQKEICQNLRRLILKTLPDVKEEMKWGVPAFAEMKNIDEKRITELLKLVDKRAKV